ncbi:MAG TPA: DUF4157 domain-containing protein [Pyrinomonadaceae bacterium]|nr:DUF4157 domain-containing protein [Pyrinomonadaceae bacterium]
MNVHEAAYTSHSAQSVSWLPGAALQRKCGCGTHTVGGASCSECEKKKTLGLQAKLTMGQADDVYEREADLVADRVLSSPGQGTVKPTAMQIQRYAGASAASGDYVPDSVSQALAQSGMPLPRTVQQNMEQRFGHDFSQVRVHSGMSAANSARDINAQAYTVGHNIVFGAGHFAPETQQGQRLLAHELTHVVQQRTSVSPAMQRQPDKGDEVSTEEFGKELEKDGIFEKIGKAAQDKIKKELKELPKTATKAMLKKVIDLAPIDPQYKEGLKTAADAIVDVLTQNKTTSKSKCDIPGYFEGNTRDFKGMCCKGSFENAQNCCDKDKFAPNNSGSFCCGNDEFVNNQLQCEKPSAPPPEFCDPPAKKDIYGKCCKPPREVVNGFCMQPFKPQPPPQPFKLNFKLGVLDDYNIDESILNSRQKSRYDELKNKMHEFMETCPASIISLVGFADKPGTEEHNIDLGQRRADHLKFLLQLDLIRLNPKRESPWIFTRSEGENNPVDKEAGDKYSARNRRVEIEFNSVCPPLSAPAPTIPKFRPSWQLNPMGPGPGNS